MSEAFSVLLGVEAKGLSAKVVSRLKAQWLEEWQQWDRRDLSSARYLYWWADGIHTGVKREGANSQCLLAIVGVTPEGRTERVAIADGFRESTASRREVLLDLKARGLRGGPLLTVGDGAMGFWAALEEVFPATRTQRCWFHKLGNVVNALPASQQARAKAAMQKIFMAAPVPMPRQRSRHSSQRTRQSIQKRRRSSCRTGTVCWHSRTFLPSTGSIYGLPIRLRRRSPRCGTGLLALGTACRGQPSWDWRSS